MAAVSQNGYALQFATEELKGDREVVMTAVSQNGCALKFTTEEMKGDREVVMTAVSQNGYALHFATAELRGDEDLVMTALAKRNGSPLIVLRVLLLSGKVCNQLFHVHIHTMNDVLQECADLLGS